MYKKAILENGVEFSPIATLVSDSGGRAQIHIDDHCYAYTGKKL